MKKNDDDLFNVLKNVVDCWYLKSAKLEAMRYEFEVKLEALRHDYRLQQIRLETSRVFAKKLEKRGK